MRPANLRQFCTDKFIKDHIHVHEDSGAGADKRANVKAHQREVGVSTMVYIDAEYMKLLWGEVFGRNRDGTYATNPAGAFDTGDHYMFMESTERSKAKRRGPAKFRYAVQYDDTDRRYKVHHFDGII